MNQEHIDTSKLNKADIISTYIYKLPVLDDDCLFCKILKGEIPSDKVYEDDNVLAFKDINPQAPVHIIVIPKDHIESIADIDGSTSHNVSNVAVAIAKIAKEQKLENGFRVISNVGDDGAQSVKHLHFHILGGKKLLGTMG